MGRKLRSPLRLADLCLSCGADHLKTTTVFCLYILEGIAHPERRGSYSAVTPFMMELPLGATTNSLALFLSIDGLDSGITVLLLW